MFLPRVAVRRKNPGWINDQQRRQHVPVKPQTPLNFRSERENTAYGLDKKETTFWFEIPVSVATNMTVSVKRRRDNYRLSGILDTSWDGQNQVF